MLPGLGERRKQSKKELGKVRPHPQACNVACVYPCHLSVAPAEAPPNAPSACASGGGGGCIRVSPARTAAAEQATSGNGGAAAAAAAPGGPSDIVRARHCRTRNAVSSRIFKSERPVMPRARCPTHLAGSGCTSRTGSRQSSRAINPFCASLASFFLSALLILASQLDGAVASGTGIVIHSAGVFPRPSLACPP